MKPVYFINGFLESGKTQFLKYTLAQQYFQIKGTTLLILCEEGEEEYDDQVLKNAKVIVEKIEDQEDFTVEKLSQLEKDWKPERIVVEYNGMWNNKDLQLPANWNVEQQITCIDASTFPTYYNNMKSLVAEMVRKSELIIFNRCDTVMDNLATYRRNIKAVNASADVVFENSQGEINEIFEEDLPYDLKDNPLVLTDETYGIWYMDTMDHPERYMNKEIEFVGQVMKPPVFDSEHFVPGRMAMTCCAEDMTFLGYACKYDKIAHFKEKDWVKVRCELKVEFFAPYKGEGPMLYAKKIEKAPKPKQEVIGF